MPIQLKLRDDLEEAIAAYKHYDVLMVNAMFDGMNLVAKEGPIVNERDGVSILSENTGAHEELGEFALSVNPFDIQETGRLDPRGADDGPGGARAPPLGAWSRSSPRATRATGSTTSSRTSARRRAAAHGRRRRPLPHPVTPAGTRRPRVGARRWPSGWPGCGRRAWRGRRPPCRSRRGSRAWRRTRSGLRRGMRARPPAHGARGPARRAALFGASSRPAASVPLRPPAEPDDP